MLSKRIIPTVLCRGRQMVKGKRFESWRTVGVAAQAVRVHQLRGADEIVLLDIEATREGRGPDLELVCELSQVCFIPITVGGGVRSLNDIVALLRAGADKVVIGTAAMERPGLIAESAQRIGRQAVTVAIDVRDGLVWTHGGKVPTKVSALEHASNCEFLGAGEILLTSMDREGTLKGYDLELIGKIAPALQIPVVAHGGCGSYEDMLKAFQAGADAVAAGAMFQFEDTTTLEAARYLQERGVETRIPARF